ADGQRGRGGLSAKPQVSPNGRANCGRWRPQFALVAEIAEEVVALVVDDDEGREIDDVDLPHRLHAELGIFQDLDMLDAVLGEAGRGAADRAEIEAAMLL